MIDPIFEAFFINITSAAICGIVNKVSNKLFREKDIEDIISKLSLDEVIAEEISFVNIPEIDTKELELFLKTDRVTSLIAEIYTDSDKELPEIELEFVNVFCSSGIIPDDFCDEFSKILFKLLQNLCNEALSDSILKEGEIAHDYKEEARNKKTLQAIATLSEGVEQLKQSFQDVNDNARSFVDIEYIDEELGEAIALIKNKQYEDAKLIITSVIGILKTNSIKNKKKISRAYHLLGICYNRIREEGGDESQAERYLNLSIETDRNNLKAKATLASFYLNISGRDNYEKSYNIINAVWDESEKIDPQFLEVKLWSTAFYKSPEDAISFFESSKEAQLIADKNDIISNVIAQLYLEKGNTNQALKYIEKSVKKNPNLPYNLHTKGNVLSYCAFSEDAIFSNFEISPRFAKYDLIESAVDQFNQALNHLDGKNELILEQRIKKDLYHCLILLQKGAEKETQDLRSTINLSLLGSYDIKVIEFLDFVKEYNDRNLSVAYAKLIDFAQWNDYSYETKKHLSKLFLFQGGPEEAKKILKHLNSEAILKKDITYWIDLSLVEALLDNKTGMLRAILESKKVAVGTKDEKIVLAHNCFLIKRYADKDKEIDRYLDSLREYDSKFPEEQVIRSIQVLDGERKPTEEIIQIVSSNKEKYEKSKKEFKGHCYPSYLLENFYGSLYAEIMNSRHDPDYPINYYHPSNSFKVEMENNFHTCECFIFDYSSLLNISKMNLLEELDQIEQKICITKSLFDKIQSELIGYENDDLRNLWEYLRKTNLINIVEIDADSSNYKEISDVLDKWIIDSIELASITENSVFMADDLNFLRLLKEYKINGCITYFVLNFFLENGFIDTKAFSIALGTLAERIYIVLPFDGEDLYHIVMDDECKIQLRSYHLINHITIPEVRPSTYTQQFEYFIEKLWRSGSLFEDKVNWLALITERMIFAINQRHDMGQKFEVDMLLYDIKKIWKNIVSLCTLSDLTILEERCITLFETEPSNSLEDFVLSIINQRRAVLSDGDAQLSEY